MIGDISGSTTLFKHNLISLLWDHSFPIFHCPNSKLLKSKQKFQRIKLISFFTLKNVFQVKWRLTTFVKRRRKRKLYPSKWSNVDFDNRRRRFLQFRKIDAAPPLLLSSIVVLLVSPTVVSPQKRNDRILSRTFSKNCAVSTPSNSSCLKKGLFE